MKLSIFVGCSIFVVSLCVVLSYLSYSSFSRSLYRSYELRLDDVLKYVDKHIDKDDLAECTRTKVESPKYKELRDFMDNICDNFGVHYLYIMMPKYENGNYGMECILSADTTYNRKNNPDGLYLGYITTDEYSDEEVISFMNRLGTDGITYLKNYSDWGYDYTAMEVLKDSAGNRFGFLCVDIEVNNLERTINRFLVLNVCIVIALGILFTALFLAWINTNVTDPISRLKESVVSFASRSHNNKELSKLNYNDPEIRTRNEVEELSDAVSQMTSDIKTYIGNMLDAEDKVEVMKNQVSHMGEVVYQDALTRVKNKAWYDMIKDRLDDDIENGRARFGIVMIDLNWLKVVNDTYGHERGDEYISGSCHTICGVFVHSSVARVGGDEFVVLLERADYDNRDDLLSRLRAAFENSSNDETREPWLRYSAAMGMAIYDKDNDGSVDDVFKRADTLMYKDKQKQKASRR